MEKRTISYLIRNHLEKIFPMTMACILIFLPKYSNNYLVSANDYNATTKKKYATLMGKEKFNPFYCNEHVIKTDITICWS